MTRESASPGRAFNTVTCSDSLPVIRGPHSWDRLSIGPCRTEPYVCEEVLERAIPSRFHRIQSICHAYRQTRCMRGILRWQDLSLCDSRCENCFDTVSCRCRVGTSP